MGKQDELFSEDLFEEKASEDQKMQIQKSLKFKMT